MFTRPQPCPRLLAAVRLRTALTRAAALTCAAIAAITADQPVDYTVACLDLANRP
jgi:hypothetical protein